MPEEIKETGMLYRAVGVRADSMNEAERTIETVWATDTPIKTYDWNIGEYMEILSFEDGHIRKDRLNIGLPILDNHNKWSGTQGVLGIAENFVIGKKDATTTLRFSQRNDYTKGVFQDVKDKILKTVSAGYKVYAYIDTNPTRKAGELPILKAIDWEPHEISMAPIPADIKSKMRSEDKETSHATRIITETSNSNNKMSEETKETNAGADGTRSVHTPPAPAAPVPQPEKVDVEGVRKEAVEAERKRSAEIVENVRKLGLGEEFAQKLVNDGTPIEAARKLIIDKYAETDPLKGQGSMHFGADETDKRRSAMTDALMLRTGVEDKTITAERASTAREFRGLTMLDMARMSLESLGVNTKGMDKLELIGRAFTQSGSDFPVLLEGTNRRTLLAAYASVKDVWREFCSIGSVSNFLEHKRLRMGSFSNLDALGENREFKNKSIPDAEYEKIKASTKGNIIAVSREMVINDDLGGFTRLASMLGRAAARSIEADVFALLLSNSGNGPTMSDGNALFHASHGNIGTGAALSVSSIDADRVLMAQQKDPSANDFIGLRPSILLVPSSLGGAARVINSSQYDTEVSSKFQVPNKVAGLYSKIIDTPRITGTTRFSLCSPAEEPVFEVCFLDGNQTPYLESQNGWRVDGTEWKVRLDYGVGAVGFRGIIKNAGA